MQTSAVPFHSAHAQIELSGDHRDLLAHFESLRRAPYPWLLDSSLPTKPLGHFSFAGCDPYLVLRVCRNELAWEQRRDVGIDLLSILETEQRQGRRVLDEDPLDWVRRLLPHIDSGTKPGLPFIGGAVGYFGYELGRLFEPALTQNPAQGLDLPDLYLLFVDRLLVYDHEAKQLFASAQGFGPNATRARKRAEAATRQIAQRVQEPGPKSRVTRQQQASLPNPHSRREPPSFECAPGDISLVGEDLYTERIDTILRAIQAGDVYQACLTHQIACLSSRDPWQTYLRLRSSNPAPFASYFELPEVQILSSSPERFLRVDPKGNVESRPIKGTRPRGSSTEADDAFCKDLLDSPKECAENLMIADLVRNDLGRVCQLGSIRVPALQTVEKYATVLQMVSSVEGQLRRECDALDALRAAFPPGSMTGAPKIAAITLLQQLETVHRGIYSGALGYLDCRGGMDLSVVIRTILIHEGIAYVHVGGGIVADSDPQAEYEESLLKAKALLEVLREDAPQ